MIAQFSSSSNHRSYLQYLNYNNLHFLLLSLPFLACPCCSNQPMFRKRIFITKLCIEGQWGGSAGKNHLLFSLMTLVWSPGSPRVETENMRSLLLTSTCTLWHTQICSLNKQINSVLKVSVLLSFLTTRNLAVVFVMFTCKFLIDFWKGRSQGQSSGFAEASYKIPYALPKPTTQSQHHQLQQQDFMPGPKIKAAIWPLYQARKMLMAPERHCFQKGDYRGKPTHRDKQVKGGSCPPEKLFVFNIQTEKLGEVLLCFSVIAEW